MRILIAEDDPVSATLLTALLSPYGNCETAADGAQAVRAFLGALAHGERYDLVCLDIMMPHLDGQETLEVMRALESMHGIRGGDCCRIVMVTALGDTKNVIRSFRGQCEGYLVKPYEADRLVALLAKLGIEGHQ